MDEYRVTWIIEVDADDPRDAAESAREAVTRTGSIATVYHVQRIVNGQPVGESIRIDLDEDDEQEGAPTTLTIRREGGETYTRV